MAGTARSSENPPAPEMSAALPLGIMLVLLVLLLMALPVPDGLVMLDMKASAAAPMATALALDIDFDGTLSLNGRVVDRASLDGFLALAAGAAPQPVVQIHVNHLARYDELAWLLAESKRLGFRRIAIVRTEDELNVPFMPTL